MGGDCTFTGCVPSKTLLAAAARGESFASAMAAVHTAVDRVAAADDVSMAQAGVEVIEGRGRLHSAGEVDVGDQRLRSPHIILATGGRPTMPAVEGLAEIDPLTNESIFELAALPDRLAVLGGGAIGCEMAQAFARLGSAVTVIEGEARLLPREEPEASQVIADELHADSVKLFCGERLKTAGRLGGGQAARLRLASGAVLDADRVLVAVGRQAATDGLGLSSVGVELDGGGYLRTADTMATSVQGIWAAGDVTGRMPFTHAAARMAMVAVHNALGGWRSRLRPRRFDPAPIPWVTFTSPEVARVGMTEAQAARHGGRVAYLPMDAVDRGITSARTNGFVKLVAGPRRLLRSTGGSRIVGATIVAPTAGEMIHEPALAMHTAMFTGRLAQATHAYPTWSMAIQQAAAQFFMERDGRSARPAQGT